jgi:hypothetical protein
VFRLSPPLSPVAGFPEATGAVEMVSFFALIVMPRGENGVP